MARPVPPGIARALPELDAEAQAFLKRQPLPAWIALYRYRNDTGGETKAIVWRSRKRRPHGDAVPTMHGHPPRFAAHIEDTARLAPSARYAMRLWMAKHRQRLAIRRGDRAAQRAAAALWAFLLRHPPSMDHGARNIAGRNVAVQAALAPLIERCKTEAARMKKDNPRLSDTAVAALLKAQLSLPQSPRTIRRWLK